MSHEIAKYIPVKLAALAGNPLIEALRTAMRIEEFAQALIVRPEYDSDLTEEDDFIRELSVELVETTYTLPPDQYTLYKSCVKNIFTGYLHRNPLSSETKRTQYLLATTDDYCLPPSINLSKCDSVIGLSGAGKTQSIRKCLSLLPQVIEHTEYKGQPFRQDQIVYLEFEAPSTKTQKGFILNFFQAVDDAVGTKYYKEWNKTNVVVAVLIKEAKKIAYNHFIGLIFVDEIQRCVGASEKADKATLGFIDNFFNDVGIPMIVAGTYQVTPLYRTTMSTTRRLTSGRTFYYNGFNNDLYLSDESGRKVPEINRKSFWSVFVDSLYHPELLINDFEFDLEFKEYLHSLTCGLPALVVRMMRLAYEEAISSGTESITIGLLNDIYDDQFTMLHPALASLRKGQFGGYEDLVNFQKFLNDSPHIVDEHIEENIKHRVKNDHQHEDEGLTIEFPDHDSQTYMPKNDLRNLKGLSREEMTANLLRTDQ